jgi:hypothetical protein
MRYAASTSVSPERTKADIEDVLRRYGAQQFAYAWEGPRAVAGFGLNGRAIRFTVHTPDSAITERTPKGRQRRPKVADAHNEQAVRQKWRALLLIIKAKLEAVDSGIVTLEEEFLSHIVMKGGKTVGEWAIPKLPEGGAPMLESVFGEP